MAPDLHGARAMTALARTLALRRCAACGTLFGVRLWPWSGALWLETHGLCGGCHRSARSALEATAPANAR